MPGKERDPAFLYYDADVARDVQFMNRTQRGCYYDLVQAYRKYRGYTMEQLRTIFGTDFELCWHAVEMVLEFDESTGKYHIPWLKTSIQKRSQNSDTQRERIQTYWDSVKAAEAAGLPKPSKRNKHGKKRGNSKEIPRYNPGTSTVIPLVNANVNANANQDEVGGTGEGEGQLPGEKHGPFSREGPPWPEHASELPERMVEIFIESFPAYPRQKEKDFAACLQLAYQIAELNGWTWQATLDVRMADVLKKWRDIVVWVAGDKWFGAKSLHFLNDKFQDLIQAKNNGRQKQHPDHGRRNSNGPTNGLDPTKIVREGIGKL